MSNKVIYNNTETARYVLKRRRKITIIEEEEILGENVVQEPFEDMFTRIIEYDNFLLPRRAPISLECTDALAIDDLEERKELAKIIGLSDVPPKNPHAFEELSGLFDELTDAGRIDVVNMVKALRRR